MKININTTRALVVKEFQRLIQDPIWYGNLIEDSTLITDMVYSDIEIRRMQISEYDNLTDEQISILALDSSEKVRSIISKHINLNEVSKIKLLVDNSELVQSEIFKRSGDDLRRQLLFKKKNEIITSGCILYNSREGFLEFRLEKWPRVSVFLGSTYRVLGANLLPHDKMFTAPIIRHSKNSIKYAQVFCETKYGTFPKTTVIDEIEFNAFLLVVKNLNLGLWGIWKQVKRGSLAGIGVYDCENKTIISGELRLDIKKIEYFNSKNEQ